MIGKMSNQIIIVLQTLEIKCQEKQIKHYRKYINNQKWCDCQLITLLNACIFYNKIKIKPYSKKYNILAEITGSVHGSCLNKNVAYDMLGVSFENGKMDFNWIKNNLPVEFSVFCHRGYHSVLAVKVKNDKIQLANYYRNKLYSISWNSLIKMQNRHVKPSKIIMK